MYLGRSSARKNVREQVTIGFGFTFTSDCQSDTGRFTYLVSYFSLVT